MLFILYEPLVHFLNYEAVNNQKRQKMSKKREKYKIVLELLKDSTKFYEDIRPSSIVYHKE